MRCEYIAHGNLYRTKYEAKMEGSSRNPLDTNTKTRVIVRDYEEAKELINKTVEVYSKLIRSYGDNSPYYVHWEIGYVLFVTHKDTYKYNFVKPMSATTYRKEILK